MQYAINPEIKSFLKRKKLAFIIPSLKAGGAERVVSTLANQLVGEYEILLVVLYKCKPFYPLHPKVQIAFCKETYNEQPSFIQSINNHFFLINRSKKIIRKHQSDIIIGFTTNANIYSILVAKQLKIPSIVSERIHPKYGSISNFWVKVRKLIYPKTNALVIQTEDIKNYFAPFVNERKLFIINNPLAEELVEQRKLNLDRANNIVCVGRLEKQKNQELLINAFSKVDNTNWKLLFIGDGKLKNKYATLVNTLNLNNRVSFLGNIKNVSEYYNNSKIFVLPSNYEGFPNALIEAMFFGMACIATNCPSGPSEIINNSENGFLIPVNNQALLEEKLTSLMKSKDLQEKFSQNATESTNQFKADFIANKWKELIKKVCA